MAEDSLRCFDVFKKKISFTKYLCKFHELPKAPRSKDLRKKIRGFSGQGKFSWEQKYKQIKNINKKV